MKRFASHYLLLPHYGLLKQYVVEVEGEYAVRAFSLSEESECVQWMPGVSLLLPKEEGEILCKYAPLLLDRICSLLKYNNQLTEIPIDLMTDFATRKLSLYRLYPFDFATMLPTELTKIAPLL